MCQSKTDLHPGFYQDIALKHCPYLSVYLGQNVFVAFFASAHKGCSFTFKLELSDAALHPLLGFTFSLWNPLSLSPWLNTLNSTGCPVPVQTGCSRVLSFAKPADSADGVSVQRVEANQASAAATTAAQTGNLCSENKEPRFGIMVGGGVGGAGSFHTGLRPSC